MSGGKYTSESVVFEPVILPAILDTLVKCGTEAVSEAGKAVELEKLIKQEKSEYLRRMNEQINKTNEILSRYKENLLLKIREAEVRLRDKGVNFESTKVDDLSQRLKLLTQLLNADVNGEPKSLVTPQYISLKTKESEIKWFERITSIVDSVISEDIPTVSDEFKAFKEKAALLLKLGDVEGLKTLFGEVTSKNIEAQKQIEQKKCLKKLYDDELAKAKGLCHITHTLTPYPVFSFATAEKSILELKKISEKQIRLLEEIRKNPSRKMSEEEKKKASETVAERLCAVMLDNGISLKKVSYQDNGNTFYYLYDEALLKINVTTEGFVSFQIVGDPQNRTGETRKDEEKVLSAMKHFQSQFPLILEKINGKKSINLTLHREVEPCKEIVEYELPMTEEEKRINDQAIIAALNSANQFRYANGE